jgi:hypothetical protein
MIKMTIREILDSITKLNTRVWQFKPLPGVELIQLLGFIV